MKHGEIELEIIEGDCEDCYFMGNKVCTKPLTEDLGDCVNDFGIEIIFKLKPQENEKV